MDTINQLLAWAFGVGGTTVQINVPQMALRAVVVYVATVVIVRMGKKRFMSRATIFDVILGIMLGSLVSRAITGTAPFAPTLAAVATLLAIHWLFSASAVRWYAFGGAASPTGVLARGDDPRVSPITSAGSRPKAGEPARAEPLLQGLPHPDKAG